MKLLLLLGLFAVFISVYAPITKTAPAAPAAQPKTATDRELNLLQEAHKKLKAAKKANKGLPPGEDLVDPKLSKDENDVLRKNKDVAVLIEDTMKVLNVPESKYKAGFWRKALEKLHIKKQCLALNYRQSKAKIKVKLADLTDWAAENKEAIQDRDARILSLNDTIESLERQRQEEIASRDQKIRELTCDNWHKSWLIFDQEMTLRAKGQEIEGLKGKNAQLQGDLNIAKMKIEHLESKVRKLQEEKKQLESRIRELTAENDVLERWVNQLIDQNRDLSRKNERKARLIRSLDDKVASLQVKLVARNMKIRSLNRQLEIQAVTMSAYVKQINDLQLDKTKLQGDVKEATKEKDRYLSEASVLSGKLEKLEEWKAETLKQVTKLEADKEALEKEKANLQKEHEAEVARINAAKREDVLRLSNDIELKNLRIQTLEGDYERFRTLHESSQGELATIKSEHEFAKTTITDLRTQVNNLDKERQAEKTAAQTANDARASLDKAVGVLETKLTQTEQAEKDLNRIKGELEKEITKLEGEVKRQKDKKKGYKEGKATTEAQLQEERKHSLEVQHALDAARTKQSELDTQIENYKAEVSNLTGRIMEIETSAAGERKDLNKTISELRAENLKNAEEIGSLKQSAANLEQTLIGLRETERILNDNIATKQGENNAIKELREEDRKKAQDTIAEMIKQASGHQKTIEDLQAKIKKTEAELKTAGTEKSGALAELQSLKEQYRQTEQRIAAEHTELQKRANALERDLMAANGELGGLKALVEDLKKQREDFKTNQENLEEKEQRYAKEASILTAKLLKRELQVQKYKLKKEHAEEKAAAAKKAAKKDAKAAAEHAAEREQLIKELEEQLEAFESEALNDILEYGTEIRLLEDRIVEINEENEKAMEALVAAHEKEKVELAAEVKKILTDAKFDCQCPTASAWTKMLHSIFGHDTVNKEELMTSIQNNINAILYKKKIDDEDNKVKVKITQSGPDGKATLEVDLDDEQWNLYNGLGGAARIVLKHKWTSASS